METPDFYTLLNTEDKTVQLHDALILLFEKMMNEAGIEDPEKLQKLAALRAKIDIELKNF